MKLFIRFCLPVIFVSIISCDMKSQGWWHEDQIAVIANQDDWDAIQAPLKQLFEKVVRTPQIETLYSLKHIHGKEVNRYTKFRYLIIAATLQSQGTAREIIQQFLSDPEKVQKIKSGEHLLFVSHESFVKNQMIVFVVADNLIGLQETFEENGEQVYNLFHSAILEDMRDNMVKQKWDKRITEKMMSSYGWSIHFQKDYFIAKEYPTQNFAWFRRTHPERWIFVRWIDRADTSYLNQEWIIRERNRIGRIYYGNDYVEDKYLFSFRGTFLDRPAQITTGLWGNEEKFVGGPFKNYTFFDPVSERLYMVDLAVHAPNKDKMPFLKRMDIVASTFRTTFDRD